MKKYSFFILFCVCSFLLYSATPTSEFKWTLKLKPKYPIIENVIIRPSEDIENGYFELDANVFLEQQIKGFEDPKHDIIIDFWARPGEGKSYVKLNDGNDFVLKNIRRGKTERVVKLPWDIVRKAQEIHNKPMSDWTYYNKIYFTTRETNAPVNNNNPNSYKDKNPGYFYLPLSKLKGRISDFGILGDEYGQAIGSKGLRFEYHFINEYGHNMNGKHLGLVGMGLQFSRTKSFNQEDLIYIPYTSKKSEGYKYNRAPQYFTSLLHPECGKLPIDTMAIQEWFTCLPEVAGFPHTFFIDLSDDDRFMKDLHKLLGSDEVFVRGIAWLPQLNETGVIGSDSLIKDIPIQEKSLNTNRLYRDGNGYWQVEDKRLLIWIDSIPVYFDIKFSPIQYWKTKYWRRNNGDRHQPVRNNGNRNQLTGKSVWTKSTVGKRQELMAPYTSADIDQYPYGIKAGDIPFAVKLLKCKREKTDEGEVIVFEYRLTNKGSKTVTFSILSDSAKVTDAPGNPFEKISTGFAPNFVMKTGVPSYTLTPNKSVIIRHIVPNLSWQPERINAAIPIKVNEGMSYIPFRNVFVDYQDEKYKPYNLNIFNGKIGIQLLGVKHEGKMFIWWRAVNKTGRRVILSINPDNSMLKTSDGKVYKGAQLKLINGAGDYYLNTEPYKLDIPKYDYKTAYAIADNVDESITSFTLKVELTDGDKSEMFTFKDIPVAYSGVVFNPDEDVEHENGGETSAQDVVGTAKGIGPVKIGIETKKIPTSFTGLYDRYEMQHDSINSDASEYSFYRGGTLMLKASAYEFDKGHSKIYKITVPTESTVKMKIGTNQYIKTGDRVTDIWRKSGKNALIDGVGYDVNSFDEDLFPLVAAEEYNENNDAYILFALFDKKDAKKDLYLQEPWLSSDVNSNAKIKEFLIYFYENDF